MEEYVQAIREYIGPYTGQFNYDEMQFAFVDKSRFYQQAEMLQMFHPVQGATVLSSGCGFGGGLLAYHDFGARLVVGVEVDPQYVELVSIRTRQLDNVFIVYYPGASLPFPDNTFDIVDSVQVLEHVHQPQLYLDEIVRVLKPGGMCYLEFPNRLYPVEQHTRIPLITFLPKRLGDRLCKLLSQWPGFSRQLRDRLRVVEEMTAWYPALIDVAWVLRRHPVRVHYVGTVDQRFLHLNRFKAIKLFLPTLSGRVIFYKL